MSFPETRSSASAACAAMQLRRMAFVSVSEAGGRLGRSLKGQLGSKVMSMYPALVDTFAEYVDSVDRSLQRVEEMIIHRYDLSWQAGEPAMPPAVDGVLLALLRAERGGRQDAGADWIAFCNDKRPHAALDGRSPAGGTLHRRPALGAEVAERGCCHRTGRNESPQTGKLTRLDRCGPSRYDWQILAGSMLRTHKSLL